MAANVLAVWVGVALCVHLIVIIAKRWRSSQGYRELDEQTIYVQQSTKRKQRIE